MLLPRKQNEGMKIVIRAPNWLGDAILSFPAIKNLKKNLPAAQIWIAAREWMQDLFLGLDFIDGVLPLPELNSLKHFLETAEKIRARNFDAGLLLTNSFSSALLFCKARIPQRWGYLRDGRGLLLTKAIPVKESEHSLHQVNYYLNLIRGLGFQTDSQDISLRPTLEEKENARKMLLSSGADLDKPLVILNPGASYGPAKRWPVARFAELVRIFRKRIEVEMATIGSKEEVDLANALNASSKIKLLNLAGKTSLRQLRGIISHASLFITNDSGPMHMANALRIPVIAIFGPTDPRITGPVQQPSVVVKKDVPCWPCHYRSCPYDHRCMLSIEPEEVFALSQNFLPSNSAK